MAEDEREQEREFLVGLKARTGRDLAQWMAAITAQGLQDKNEIIDWLRNEGLPFARASWLERIHRNGGKPIHAGSSPSAAVSDARAGGSRPATPAPRLVMVASTPRPTQLPKATPPPVQVAAAPPANPRPPVEPGVAGADPKPAAKAAKKAPKPPPLVEAPAKPGALEKLVAAA